MFFNRFKNYLLKRKLKKCLSRVSQIASMNKVQTIGILVDESTFFQTLALKQSLIDNNFLEKDISIIAFRNPNIAIGACDYPVFGWKQISWSFQVQEDLIQDFVQKPFDTLISYYESDNSLLQWLTLESKAKFKVGFFAIDKRLNHVLINTQVQNCKIFVQEFVRVLKLFNKI